MEFNKIVMVSGILILLSSSSTNAQTGSPPPQIPTPAPAPAPANLTELLTVAGPFHTFLNYLQSTKVIQTFQNQANNTDQGITIFVPKDEAFSALKKPSSLNNLTQEQLKSLLLFHGLPNYYSLAEFKNLSQSNPVSTFAGGPYTLNFTDLSGTIHISSGWTKTKVISSVHSTDPVALYEIDQVLLPVAIFGTDIPPTPAPAPAPATSSGIAPISDSPGSNSPAGSGGEGSPKSSPTSSAPCGWGVLNSLVFAVSGGLFLFL